MLETVHSQQQSEMLSTSKSKSNAIKAAHLYHKSSGNQERSAFQSSRRFAHQHQIRAQELSRPLLYARLPYACEH